VLAGDVVDVLDAPVRPPAEEVTDGAAVTSDIALAKHSQPREYPKSILSESSLSDRTPRAGSDAQDALAPHLTRSEQGR